MIKKILIVLGVLLAAIYLIYNFPGFSSSFKDIYRDVDDSTTSSLQAFRRDYPLKQLEFKGETWEYLAVGQGNEAILLLHGMTGSYDIWWQQVLDLKKDYLVISLTYPPVKSLKELGEGIREILRSEAVQSVKVVGSSLGGYLTQYLVANYPGLIEKAVFGNTFPPDDARIAMNSSQGKWIPLIPEWLLMRHLRRQTEASAYPAAGHSELVKAFLLEQTYGRMSKEQFLARFYCVINDFSAPNIATSGIPVLIVEADNDPLVGPEVRNLLKKTYPSALVKTLPGVGHFPYLNQPESYNQIIRRFFSRE